MQIIRSRRNYVIGATLCALIAGLGIGQAVLQNKADAQPRTVHQGVLWPRAK